MLDVFEYPWLLLGVSLALLMIMGTLRCVFPEKRHWCQMAIPLLVAAGSEFEDLTQRAQAVELELAAHIRDLLERWEADPTGANTRPEEDEGGPENN